jgi:hypothetical protein
MNSYFFRRKVLLSCILKLLFCILILINSQAIFACSCGFHGSFDEAISKSDILIHVKVIERDAYWDSEISDYIGNYSILEVKQQFKGELQSREIKLVRAPVCANNFDISIFELNHEYILTLKKNFNDSTYSLIGCYASEAFLIDGKLKVFEQIYNQEDGQYYMELKHYMDYSEFIKRYAM